MRWVNYCSLNRDAKLALDAGSGRHGKFIVDGNHIAAVDKSGRAMDWILVVRGGDAIRGIEADTERA